MLPRDDTPASPLLRAGKAFATLPLRAARARDAMMPAAERVSAYDAADMSALRYVMLLISPMLDVDISFRYC